MIYEADLRLLVCEQFLTFLSYPETRVDDDLSGADVPPVRTSDV